MARVEFEMDALAFENGTMFGRVTIDGAAVRAGITRPAFERLIQRAGFDADCDLGEIMVGDLLETLRPTIEAYLQSKHFHQPDSVGALIIDVPDLVTH